MQHAAVIVLSLACAVVGGLAAGWLLQEDVPDDTVFDPTTAERLALLEARMAAIESARPREVPAPSAIDLRLEDVTRRLDALESTAPALPPQAGDAGPSEAERAAEARKRLDELLAMLGDKSNDVAFTATVELAELGDERAVPALTVAMRDHRDFYVRLGAATAIGNLKSLDAVEDLIVALDDKDQLVRTAAREALITVVGHEPVAFDPAASRSGRLERIASWVKWWDENEREVRAKRRR